MEAIIFGDIEGAIIATLPDRCGRVAFYQHMKEVPDARPARFVTCTRGGGSRRDMVTDSPTLLFECWATTKAAAFSLAQTVRAQVMALQHDVIGGLTVYRVQEVAGPAYMRHPIENQHRYVFTCALDVRYQQ